MLEALGRVPAAPVTEVPGPLQRARRALVHVNSLILNIVLLKGRPH